MKAQAEIAEEFDRDFQVSADSSDEQGETKSIEKLEMRQRLPHVLYVIDQLCQLGGAERMLLEMVRNLPPSRYRCSVVAFNVDSGLEEFKNLPVPIHVLPLRRTYTLGAAKQAWRLRRLIQEENVSIVHTFFETSDLWAAPIAKLSGCPVLISSRRDMGILRTRKHHLAYPLINRIFDQVLAVSDEVRIYCHQKDRLPLDRIKTLYNGVNLEELDRRAAAVDANVTFSVVAQPPVITTVANIRAIKGIDVLISTAKIVCQEFPTASFLVVGSVLETETMTRLQAQIRSSHLENNFKFLGPLANPFPVLKASSVFCLPSRSEGFSNALVEAMGCGLPCVATRVGGNAEAIQEGRTGYLVDSENSEAMAERILHLLRNPDQARDMGQAARTTVENQFSLASMMSHLVNIYDELLAAKND